MSRQGAYELWRVKRGLAPCTQDCDSCDPLEQVMCPLYDAAFCYYTEREIQDASSYLGFVARQL